MSKFIHRTKPIALVIIFTFIINSISIYFPDPAYAWHYPWDQGHKTTQPKPPEKTIPPTEPNQDEVGDDVNIKTGNFSYSVQDLFIPGRGLSIDITRTYNSQDKYNGILGYGWNFTYDLRLYRVVDAGQYYVVIRQGDGIRYEFTENPDGTYTSPAGRYCRLTKTAALEEYILTTKEGIKYKFAFGLLVSITDPNNNQISFGYSSQGRLLTLTDTSSRKLSFSYGANGKLATIKDWVDRTITYAYDDNGDLISVTDPLSNTTTYAYNAEHNLTEMTDPKGTAFLRNWYDSQERVTQQFYNGGYFYFNYYPSSDYTIVTDRRGNSTTHYYNDTGNPTKTIAPLGDTVTKVWDENMNLLSETDALGNPTTYTYDENGNILIIKKGIQDLAEEANGATILEHSPLHWATPDPRNIIGGAYGTHSEALAGRLIFSDYDHSNQYVVVDLGSVKEIEGIISRHVAPPGDREVMSYSVSVSLNNIDWTLIDTQDPVTESVIVSEFTPVSARYVKFYYGDGSPDWGGCGSRVYDVEVYETSGYRVKFTYEPTYNKVTSVTDPLGRKTLFEYDSKGNLIKTTDANSKQTTFTYASNGDLLTITNADSKTTTFTYNAYGYLASTEDALGNATNFTYDQVGNLISVTDARTNTASYAYDLNNRLIEITDALSNITTFAYDVNGNRTTITDAQSNITTFTYNIYDQLIAITDALTNQTQFTYDNNENLITTTDANGKVTTNTYDALDRLIKVTDALGNPTEYTYDANDNQTSIKDTKDNITTYTYDDLNRLIQTTYPDSSMESFTYDMVGNLISKTDRAGNTINYTYDDLNRLITKAYPDFSTVDYVYDVLSRLTSIQNSSPSIQYTYDALNRVTQVIQDSKTTKYEYDAVGNRTKLVYPDLTYITYEYDPLNRLITIKDQVPSTIASYSYDTLSRRTQLDYANSTQASYSYDTVNRLINLANTYNLTSSTYSYTYDKVGNRLTMTVNATDTHTYTYDSIYQLTNVDYPAGFGFPDKAYSYDAVGNRTQTVNGGTVSYTSNNINQYTQVGVTPYTYDGNGNLTSDGTHIYSYDYENRLVSACKTVMSATYTYDGFGRRIQKNVDGTITNFIYDGDQVIAEYDGTDVLLRKFAYGPGIDEPVLMNDGTKQYYYHFDALGSVTEITDSTATVVEKYDYDVYGKPNIKDKDDNTLTESAIGNPYAFTGRRFDSETQLYYYRERYYNPRIGRFLSEDPIGFWGGVNFYTYCANNPINFIDPWGLSAESAESSESMWGKGWDWWSDLVAPGEGGVIYALPGETWEEYYTRYQAIHASHYAFARSVGIVGITSAITSLTSSAAISGSERLVSEAARRTFTSFGRGGFAYVRGYHKTLALRQVASGLRTAGTASTVVTVGATTYGWGLWVNARISYLITRQE